METMKEFEVEKTPNEIVQEAINSGYEDFYVAYSGGKDSGIVLDLIAKEYPKYFRGVIFVDTGIATKATVDFVNDYCKKHNYPLDVLHPTDVVRKKKSPYGKIGEPFTFENLVLTFGFPTAGGHRVTMGYIKWFPIRKFMKNKIKSGEKACIIGGIRRKESKRRATRKSYKNYINTDGNITFVLPLYYKSNDWVMRYFIENDIKRSPVYETLHISGDCLCGCFAKKDELKLLEMFHPEVYAEIKRLEKLILEKGTDLAKENSNWGNLNTSTINVKAEDKVEAALCAECFFDRDAKEDDTKRFDNEMTEIDKKLDKMTTTGERKK